MKNLQKAVFNRQNGLGLIEILIVVPIACVLSFAAVMMIGQIFQQNQRVTEKELVVSQVESMVFWINHDALMAQTVMPDSTPGSGGFPLTLAWQGSDGNNDQVVFSLNSGGMQRVFSINNVEQNQALIAVDVDSDITQTNCSYTDNVLGMQVTSAIGKTSATRTFQVKPRVDQPTD